MGNEAYERTAEGFFMSNEQRLGEVERRLGKLRAIPDALITSDTPGMKMCAGSFVLPGPIVMDAATTFTPIVFPVGFFSATPIAAVATTSNGRITTSVSGLTADGASIGATNWSTADSGLNIIVRWVAFGT